MGLAIGNDRELAHVPPAATLFLHRKIGGMYLMAAKLRARVALRPMVEAYCRRTAGPLKRHAWHQLCPRNTRWTP